MSTNLDIGPSHNRPHPLELPVGMRSKLDDFRRRVWKIKLAEGLLAALFGLLISYLLVFALDRLWDTPAWLRFVILAAGAAGLGLYFPLKCHRWVWRTRRLDQVARLLQHKFPRLGDQMLGIVELVQSELELQRSEALCRAAIEQVDRETQKQDLRDAVPNPQHRRLAWAVGVPLALVVAALLIVPAAGTNALVRWMMPWRLTERYTFAKLDALPTTMVVPYAEPFSLNVALADDTVWTPRQANAQYGTQQSISADLSPDGYTFQLPPQKQPDHLTVHVGDAKKSVEVSPTTRPELTSMAARVHLPAYLQYSTAIAKDVRGGSVSLLKGSQTVFEAVTTRELDEATVDALPQRVDGNKLRTTPLEISQSKEYAFRWRDRLGLSTKQPFVLSVTALDDQPPTIACIRLSHEQVVLDDEVLSFEVQTDDDFGIRTVGMEWTGIEHPVRNPQPARGEKVVAAGGAEHRKLDLAATFSARREGIEPQSLEIRLFTVDYLPDRERIYSPTYVLHVLSPEQHAIWLTRQMQRWFRAAQDVYEREHQLLEGNRQLRALDPEELDRPENRRRIESQAAAERGNAGRLSGLTAAGEQLIQNAARNDQFNVATLETWAEMLQTLKDIAANRMPSVSDLLTEAANSPGNANQASPGQGKPSQGGPQDAPPQVGVKRDSQSGGPGESKPGEPSKVPSINDIESSLANAQEDADKAPEENPSPAGSGRLTLPTTIVQGGGQPQPDQQQARPAEEKVAEAVQVQEDLLAEFAKVADELQRILENLEGSTFVKRLKAASRRQLQVAADISRVLADDFGFEKEKTAERTRTHAEQLAERQAGHSDFVYLIQQDLDAYYNRVQQGKFKTVLKEMEESQVVGKLQGVAEKVQANFSGQSIAQTEYWADTLDRWAEQLVGPG